MKKLLASLVLFAFVLTGCANAPGGKVAQAGDSLPALLDAMQKTTDAGSGQMALDLSLTTPEQTIHVTGNIEYVMDPDDPTSLRERVVLDIPSLGMMPGGTVELIIAKGSAIYVKAPMLAAFIPASTPWIKLDPSTLPQGQGGLGAASAVANPAALIAAVKDALTVQEVGAETVDGADTTHYRAEIDLVKLLPLIAKLSPDAPTDADMQEAKDQLAKSGLDTLPIDLWVDGDGYLKQMRLAPDLSGIDPDHPGIAFSLTLTLSDVGEDITIDVPPASQVTDVTDLLGSGLTSTTLA